MLVLVVCRANVCRSRAAEALLTRPLLDLGASAVSAGVNAVPGSAVCPVAVSFVGSSDVALERSPTTLLTTSLIESADLILTAETEISAAVAVLSPKSRSRTFTLLRAARNARWVADRVAAGALPPDAPPLPRAEARTARWLWLVAEMDAARGHVPAAHPIGDDGVDVPDPHAGAIEHPAALELIRLACAEISSAAQVVIAAPALVVT
jgi:protein-tyrosine phosphatase